MYQQTANGREYTQIGEKPPRKCRGGARAELDGPAKNHGFHLRPLAFIRGGNQPARWFPDSEREGFEPPSRLRRIRFSRPARSATPPSLHSHRAQFSASPANSQETFNARGAKDAKETQTSGKDAGLAAHGFPGAALKISPAVLALLLRRLRLLR